MTKEEASRLYRKEINCGKIVRPKRCSACNIKSRIHGHHRDYNQPLLIVWLCSKCHRMEHCGHKADAEAVDYSIRIRRRRGKHIRLSIPSDLHQKLKQQAAEHGDTLEEWIVKCLTRIARNLPKP